MWRLHLKSDEGIAIQSTSKLLAESLSLDETIYMGAVKYIDYSKHAFDMLDLINYIIHKRKSYEHENELRAVIVRWNIVPDDGKPFDELPRVKNQPNMRIDLLSESIPNGIPVPCDITKLIEKVYVAPSAPAWFRDLVGSVGRRYGYHFDVVKSPLLDGPVW